MLDDLNIMVVEDEALLAVDLSMTLEDEGAHVAGPCYSVSAAMADRSDIDAAILDVDVRGTSVFPYADRLQAEGTPFVFHTGRADLEELRMRYGAEVPILTKPSRPEDVVRRLKAAIGDR